MAAVLIGIKARMLLPGQEVDEDGEPVDPRRELVERLLEYVRYKEASEHLLALESERAERFTRDHVVSERGRMGRETGPECVRFDLVSALKRILAEAPEEALHGVTREEYSIEEQRAFLLDRLARDKNLSFSALVENRSRAFIVATFLGVLELVQAQQVHVHIAEGDPIDFYLALRIRQDETGSEDPDRTAGRIEKISGERTVMENRPPSGMASIHELGDRALMHVAEALVFAADRPVTPREIAGVYSDVTGNDAPSDGDVLEAVTSLNKAYEASGRVFRIERWAAGFRMATISPVAPYLKSFFIKSETGNCRTRSWRPWLL